MIIAAKATTVAICAIKVRILVRCEGARLGDKPWPNYARDEGWPLEVALQEEISNHRQRLGSKAGAPRVCDQHNSLNGK